MDASRGSRDRSGHIRKRELEYGKPIASVWVQLWRKEEDASRVSAWRRGSATASGRHSHQILSNIALLCFSESTASLLISLRSKSPLMKPCRICQAETFQTHLVANISERFMGKRWVNSEIRLAWLSGFHSPHSCFNICVVDVLLFSLRTRSGSTNSGNLISLRSTYDKERKE